MTTNRLKAVVRVVLDVEADSVWSDNTTFQQISNQSCDDVRGMLTNGNILALKDLPRRIKSLEMVEVKIIREKSS